MEPSVARIAWAPWAFRTFAVVGAALFVASSLAVASASGSDGIPDDVESYTARNMVAHEAGDGFFLRSRSVGAAQDDVFEVSSSGGEFSVSSAPRSPGPETVWYRIEFRRLQEYAPEDGGGLKETGTRLDLPRDNVQGTMSNVTRRGGGPGGRRPLRRRGAWLGLRGAAGERDPRREHRVLLLGGHGPRRRRVPPRPVASAGAERGGVRSHPLVRPARGGCGEHDPARPEDGRRVLGPLVRLEPGASHRAVAGPRPVCGGRHGNRGPGRRHGPAPAPAARGVSGRTF